jgi:hypothetical protein
MNKFILALLLACSCAHKPVPPDDPITNVITNPPDKKLLQEFADTLELKDSNFHCEVLFAATYKDTAGVVVIHYRQATVGELFIWNGEKWIPQAGFVPVLPKRQ